MQIPGEGVSKARIPRRGGGVKPKNKHPLGGGVQIFPETTECMGPEFGLLLNKRSTVSLGITKRVNLKMDVTEFEC